VCGRYTLALPEPELLETFDVPPPEFDYRPRWNVAPGQECPVVAEDRRGRRMGLLRWGLVPSWMDDPPSGGFVNARAETAATKPSFREPFRRRRCLVPADGFYEWAREGERKVPRWFRPAAGGALALAGLWEGRTFTVLTTEANADVAPVHPRMPVILPPETWDAWLAAGTAVEELRGMVGPAPDGSLACRTVSTRVNTPDEDDPELVEPV
jgi:putative SOS response-associated peptidase YedK